MTVAPALCEHHYETHLLGGHPISVRVCLFCRTPDWPDLYEQAVQLYQWGRDEELAGRPPRATLSAYDMPHQPAPAAGPTIAECADNDRSDDEDAGAGSLIPPEVLAAIRRAEAESEATIAAIARFDEGPTVAEAAANDRRWPLEKEGE
ncbi:hypothetical protein [Streptomyces cyanogenus]|uniref:Uncharacterized protein n=1 Tax=Streptomyces cyanogenus TaxID=80860 RepID=A0ABX7TKW8_STRCY|nr:hypothetical protein [Streptomyces cyanogenus]QTD97011.1 hypothetical protein S1361_06580 [Streptomyces cyanogenus]